MKKDKITIDCGHGYKQDGKFDPGVSHGRFISEYNLNIFEGILISKHLQTFGCDVDLFIYDSPEKGEFLSDRGYKGKNSDIFISVHHNAYNKSAQGSECLIHNGANPDDELLADMIQKEVSKTLRIKSRGVKKGSYAVLSRLNDENPVSCLIESFFMDSVDSPKIFKFAEDSALAASIAIIKFLSQRRG